MNQPIQRPLFSCPGLATDLYQLTMAQAYWAEGMDKSAVFDLFVRDLPPERHFLIAAGLQHAIEALEGFHYDSRELRYLRSLGLFRETFLRHLAGGGFSGSARAMHGLQHVRESCRAQIGTLAPEVLRRGGLSCLPEPCSGI